MHISKRTIIIVGIGLLLTIIVAAVLAYISSRPRVPSPTPLASGQASTTTIDPIELPPISSQLQTFTITLPSTADPAFYAYVVTAQPLSSSNQAQAIPIDIAPNRQRHTVQLATKNPIAANTIYVVLVLDKASQALIFRHTYISQAPVSTPVPNNNQALAQFLPYETPSYRLRYDADQNLYIFDFNYNPKNADDAATQFDQAKAQALAFIKAKGVNPASLVIDWRHH